MITTLAAIPDLPARAAALADRLTRAPTQIVSDLDALVRRAASGAGDARDVLVAFAHLRVTRPFDLEALRAAAAAQGLERAAMILRDDAAHRALPRHGRLPEPLRPARAVHALSSRAWPHAARGMWRVHTATTREALLRDPRAAVVGALLDVEGVDLSDVLRLASRRPSTAEIVRTIAASRWLGQLPVREALVRNPFTETWLALVLLPTVRRSALVGAPVDPRLMEAARAL